MKKLFQISVACLPGGPRPDKSWTTRSYRVKARSVGEAEQLGLKLLNTDFSLTNLEDYAVFAKPFDHKTNNERNVL